MGLPPLLLPLLPLLPLLAVSLAKGLGADGGGGGGGGRADCHRQHGRPTAGDGAHLPMLCYCYGGHAHGRYGSGTGAATERTPCHHRGAEGRTDATQTETATETAEGQRDSQRERERGLDLLCQPSLCRIFLCLDWPLGCCAAD
jgi:hypothetical protein